MTLTSSRLDPSQPRSPLLPRLRPRRQHHQPSLLLQPAKYPALDEAACSSASLPPGKGTKASPPKPVRIATTATTVTASPTGKKRTSSEANLDRGSSTPSKRPATEQPALVSPKPSLLPTEPSLGRGGIARSLSPTSSSPEQPPKLVARKKKPVNIFMKRPAKRT